MTGKTSFFEGWSWLKFNNLGLARGMNLKFYTSVRKGLKVRKSEKVRQKSEKVSGVVPTILEVTGEKLVLGLIAPPSPSRPPS